MWLGDHSLHVSFSLADTETQPMPELHTKALVFGSVAASATWSHISLAVISHVAKPDVDK